MVVADDQHVSRGVRFIGSDGWVYVCRSSGSGRTYRDTQYIDAEPKSLLSMKFGPNDVRLYRSDDHKQNFLDCIRTRTQTVAPAEAGHRAIMIGHLGLIAMKLKRRLRWDGKNERFIDDEEANRMLSRPMRSPWQL